MTIKHIFFAALTVALAASCSSDDSANGTDNGQSEGKVKVTLTASAPETRVGMTKENNKATLYWQSGDNILVQTVTNSTYGGTKLTAASGTATGSTSATFVGEVTTGTELGTYAVYPYNTNHSFTGEKTLTYNLPSTYTYSKVGSQIFSKKVGEETTYPSNSTNLPMLGTISDNKATFKMLGGMAVIRIDNMPGTDGTLKVTADQQLSGNFTVADVSVENASIATSASSTGNSVTFTFAGATAGSAGVFYLPLATGTYSDLKIAVTAGSTTQTVNYGDLTIARADVKAISLTTDSEGNLRHIEKIDDYHYKINGHEFVDLGLDVLWATMNVGASSEKEDGYHVAWGETAERSDHVYSKSTYNTGMTFVDAATANWGSGVRMPTQSEFGNLVDTVATAKCTKTWKWVDQDNDCGGYTITCKANTSASIFLYRPKCYGYNGTTPSYYGNSTGYYWTSTGTTTHASYIGVSYNTIWWHRYESVGFYGYVVRAVAVKP